MVSGNMIKVIISMAVVVFLGGIVYLINYNNAAPETQPLTQGTNMKKLFPITITSQLAESKEFYTKLFDFEVVFEADWYIHMRHESGIEIAVMQPKLANQPEFLHGAYAGEGVVYSFEVDDAKSEYDRLKKLGVNIIYDLKDEEWGQRHFMLKDPAGMSIDVVQQLSQ
ncbi:VOC family protein [Acetobacteraceae bacterium]|nr:VOC family protein [Candidatus Parcubacteria bacterium]